MAQPRANTGQNNCVCNAVKEKCQLVVFGEALLSGYPFWIELTDGARFNSPVQKEIHAHYLKNAIQIEAGHLQPLCDAAAHNGILILPGIMPGRMLRN